MPETRQRADAPQQPEKASSAVGAQLRVDAHVHIYDRFPLSDFFEHAWRNLSTQAAGVDFHGLLLLTETSADDWFGRLRQAAEGRADDLPALGPWRVRGTAEAESLRLEGPGGAVLYLLAGGQIVTAEDLEVLALACAERISDGLSLDDSLAAVAAAGGIAAVPWGFGKWFGSRGALLARKLDEGSPDDFWLGDNRGRPRLWPDPKHFARGRARGFGVLPGSDPLPMAAGARQAGRYGFSLRAPFDPAHPAASLRAALSRADARPVAFGQRERALPFVRDQIWMQVLKRRRVRGAA